MGTNASHTIFSCICNRDDVVCFCLRFCLCSTTRTHEDEVALYFIFVIKESVSGDQFSKVCLVTISTTALVIITSHDLIGFSTNCKELSVLCNLTRLIRCSIILSERCRSYSSVCSKSSCYWCGSMDGICCCQRICASIDVCRKITEVIFVVDSLRCINIRNSIACLRKVNMLLKDITLDSSYFSEIINNCNVKLIVVSLSIVYIDASTRFWCESLPIYCGVFKT